MLPEERIAVTQQVVDRLPINKRWLKATAPLTTLTHRTGLNAGHAGGHLALDLPLDERWDVEIGTGGDEFANWRCRWLALGTCLRYLYLARYQL